MYTLIVQNKYGQSMELTHNSAYDITDIDGIDPPEAVINTTKNAGADGSEYNSAYVNDRQITITLCVNAPAETNRIALYKYLKAKFPVRLYYTNGTRDVYIDGYVQNIQVGFFEKKQTVQIVIACPRPYFNGSETDAQPLTVVESLFEFPFTIEEPIEFSSINTDVEKSIVNNGDVETGALITIEAMGKVVNPKIYNVDTGESFILSLTMAEGDIVTINTIQGQKSVTLLSGGVTTNLIGSMEQGSTWFTLIPGDNVFTISADTYPENMLVTFNITDQYEGV